jgi:hypothetical protein
LASRPGDLEALATALGPVKEKVDKKRSEAMQAAKKLRWMSEHGILVGPNPQAGQTATIGEESNSRLRAGEPNSDSCSG